MNCVYSSCGRCMHRLLLIIQHPDTIDYHKSTATNNTTSEKARLMLKPSLKKAQVMIIIIYIYIAICTLAHCILR